MTANLFQTDAVPVLRTRSTFTKKIRPIRNHFGTRGLNADTNTSAPECNPCWIMTSKLVHGSDMNHPRSNIRAEEPEGPDFSYQNEPLDGDALLPLLFRDTFFYCCACFDDVLSAGLLTGCWRVVTKWCLWIQLEPEAAERVGQEARPGLREEVADHRQWIGSGQFKLHARRV